jgi:hypothetical protein
MLLEYGNRIQNESHNCCGSDKAQGSNVKPVYGSEPPRANKARDEVTQKITNILVHPVPH